MFGKKDKVDPTLDPTVDAAAHAEKINPVKNEQTFADNESLLSEHTLVAQQEGIQPIFVAKCTVINKALADIGMGRYQYELFFAGGFGWFADNICE